MRSYAAPVGLIVPSYRPAQVRRIGQTDAMEAPLERARAAFTAEAWKDAFEAYEIAVDATTVEAADHERMAISAYLIGADDRCAQAWEQAHRTAQEAGDPANAARYAFWLALSLMLRGQMASWSSSLSTARLRLRTR